MESILRVRYKILQVAVFLPVVAHIAWASADGVMTVARLQDCSSFVIEGLPNYLLPLLVALLSLVGFVFHQGHRECIRSKDALQESEQRFRAIFENAAIGIAKLSLNGQFIEINKEFCRIIGYDHNEVLPRKLGFQHIICSDDIESWRGLTKRLLDGVAQSGALEKRCARKDGVLVWVELSVYLIRNVKGVPLCFIGAVRDITQRRLAEEMRLAALVYQNSTEAMMVTDANGIILDINRAFTQLTGYKAHEIIGKNPKTLKSGHHGLTFYKKMWNSINTTGHWQGEIWNRRQNGDTYAEWLSINTIFNKDGSVHRRVALFLTSAKRKNPKN